MSSTKTLMDNGGLTVGSTYKIDYKKSPCCTINLYNTSSVLLINGAAAPRFMEVHFPAIVSRIPDALAARGLTLDVVNSYMKDCISSAKRVRSKPDGQQIVRRRQFPVANRRSSSAADVAAEESPTLCPYCELEAASECVLCDTCHSWVHATCEDIPEDVYQTLADDTRTAIALLYAACARSWQLRMR